MFNSPIVFCPLLKKWVPLDESEAECRKEHRCHEEVCPLAHLFTNQQPGSGAPVADHRKTET